MRYPLLLSASLLAAASLATPAIGLAQSTTDKIENKVQSTGDKMQNQADRTGAKIKGTVDNAVDKTGDAARSAGDKTKSMAKEAGSEISDSWLTSKTKIALFADERVKGRQINVETEKGTVLLRGKVDSDEAKAAAESIAKGIDGVKAVKNELQVVAPTQRATVDATDKDIKKSVENRLAADPQLKKLDVRSDDRVVTLTGEVSSIRQSARASEVAREVSGVRYVKNDLTLKQEPRAEMGRSSAAPASQQHVRVMQQALKDNGYDPGPIDGRMGPRTVAALKAYQQKENLTVTGRADADTLGRLGVGVGGPGTPPQKKQSP